MTASTVTEYLAALPTDRRAALSAVRKAINENLPEGYEEGMQFGMIAGTSPLLLYATAMAPISAFQNSSSRLFPCPSTVKKAKPKKSGIDWGPVETI